MHRSKLRFATWNFIYSLYLQAPCWAATNRLSKNIYSSYIYAMVMSMMLKSSKNQLKIWNMTPITLFLLRGQEMTQSHHICFPLKSTITSHIFQKKWMYYIIHLVSVHRTSRPANDDDSEIENNATYKYLAAYKCPIMLQRANSWRIQRTWNMYCDLPFTRPKLKCSLSFTTIEHRPW